MEKIKNIVKKIKEDIPTVFFVMKSNDTPLITKIFAFITISYALSPIDLIPDFIPILGYLDDLLLLPILIIITIRLVPKEVLLKCRNEAKDYWIDKKSKHWVYSIPIIVFWILILLFIIKVCIL